MWGLKSEGSQGAGQCRKSGTYSGNHKRLWWDSHMQIFHIAGTAITESGLQPHI